MTSEWFSGVDQPGRKRVLAIDGGGMRGALALGILAELEQRLQNDRADPQLRLSDYFDLIGGTSTGAIIAAGLALGHSVADLIELYRTLGPRVFGQGMRIPLIQSRFDPRRLEDAVCDFLGDITLGNAPWKAGFAAVSKRVDTGSPWLISNSPRARYWLGDPEEAKRNVPPDQRRVTPNRDYRLAKIIHASAAAPFYFDMVEIDIERGASGLFFDGGITPYNNPSLLMAMVAGVPAYGFGWSYGPDELTIVSIGTGATRPSRPHWVKQRRLASAWKAVSGLSAILYDCGQQSIGLMQWLGDSPTNWTINSEVGTLAAARGGLPSMWTYLRYDAPLDPEWLRRNLNIEVSAPAARRMSHLNCHRELDALQTIGRRSGAMMIASNHLV